MPAPWIVKRILITVRTYPVPASKGIEVSCTAAISDDGSWIRLFPVPYRFLPHDKKFKKYQWIEVALQKASKDARPESYHLNIATIKLGEPVSTADTWAARRSILRPLMRPSLCAIRRERDEKGHPTLGIFKPSRIRRLQIVQGDASWTPKQQGILRQKTLGFENAPEEELQKIPYDFFYEFDCADSNCPGHRMSCTDWEMAEAYRRWRQKYGDGWEQKFRDRFERDMIEKNDTHFYVGTVHQHPKNWIIVGLFYPPKRLMPDLFE